MTETKRQSNCPKKWMYCLFLLFAFLFPASQSSAQNPGISISRDAIRIGSWNIKKLGHGSSTNFQLVASVIESNYDIIAVIEVMQKQNGHPGYDKLLTSLGSCWKGLITDSPRPKTSAGDAEYYAILYRDSRIQPCPGWNKLIHHIDNDGSPSGSGTDCFAREPAYGCFGAPRADNSIGVDFILAAYHARWAEGDKVQIKEEAKHLKEVFGSMQSAMPNEHDLFIAGDFNLVPSELRQSVSYQVKTEGHGSGSTLNSKGEKTANLYDHFLVYDEKASKELIGDPEIMDVRSVAATRKGFFKTMSDHLPIRVLLNSAGPDDD